MVVLHSREEAELSAYDKYCQRGFLRVRRKEVEDIDPVGGAVGVGRFTVGEGGIRFKRKWVVDDSYDESADDCE
ncbi:hypothetical protein KXX29_007920 [Aspergillus fumigatus]|nr:hypothetical protein KXX29_007920 [Aspergillus fumigatus]KAH1578071.1 hypothetical protein KXX17_006951 [Aspergillus fumigatus]KAH2249721.1 hypothetical protein KXW14_004119 [Aspergillus fumigatus]KAH2393621.1 hypothetical protein KXV62_009287 [Aspergillus fumigatus]KAH2556686.1 hypothetical protein KXW12_000002 [Aspergillus fumigatus]